MEKRLTRIDTGYIQGAFGYDPRITVFKGIPYAKAPVGELRWRSPQPVEPWEGVRNAFEYGPMAVQNTPGADPNEFWTKELHPAGPEFEMSEDCLYVNVYTPAKKGDEKLPVFFYIHGGGLTGGYPYEVEFDWEHMARKGIVVVTVAYRLGIFGFFAHPELSAEAPDDPKGNYGYLDQLAALRWTKRNIEAFGGDPDKITIAGQSAGAGSVLAHLSSPMSAGLFRAAIVESGITIPFRDTADRVKYRSIEEAEQNGIDFFAAAGIGSIKEARELPSDKLHALFRQQGVRITPVIDGIFLKETTSDALFGDRWGDVPVIFGFNSGELQMFKRFSGTMPETMDDLKVIAARYGEDSEKFMELTGCKTDEDVVNLTNTDDFLGMVISTYTAACTRASQGYRAYIYMFDHPIPGEDNPGVYHGAELPFAYDALARMWRPYTGKDYDMARKVNSYWINFITTTDPNGLSTIGEELPCWCACTTDRLMQMYFGDTEAYQREVKLTDLMKMRIKNTLE